MKSTTKRFSLGIKIASILTCFVVAAVGFASWLIVKPVAPVTESGSFTVHEVEIVDVALDVAAVDSSSSIVFGKGTTTNANPWLRATSDMGNEALTAKFDVTINTQNENVALNTVASKFDVTFGIVDTFVAKFNAAIGGYIAAPVINIKNGDTVVSSATYNKAATTVSIDAAAETSQTFTIEIVFDWGTITEGNNPYTFFNATTATDENIAKADDFLTKIFEITNATTTDQVFNLTVAAVAKA